MAPERSPKRQKTSTRDELASARAHVNVPTSPGNKSDDVSGSPQRSSWYASWSRNAPPVTQVARESIRSVSATGSEAQSRSLSPKPKSIRSPSLAMTLGKKSLGRGLPASATTTVIHAEANNSSRKSSQPSDMNIADKNSAKTLEPTLSRKDTTDSTDSTARHETVDLPSTAPNSVEKPPVPSLTSSTTRTSWLGWLAKNDVQPAPPDIEGAPKTSDNKANSAVSVQTVETVPHKQDTVADTDSQSSRPPRTVRTSWIPWVANSEGEDADLDSVKASTENPAPDNSKPAAQGQPSVEPKTATTDPSKVSSVETLPAPSTALNNELKPSGWAFWSRDRKANDSNLSINRPREGELAVSDTPSQAKPRRTSISVPKDSSSVQQSNNSITSAEVTTNVTKTRKSNEPMIAVAENTNASATVQEPTDSKKSASTQSAKTYNNLLLPELMSTLRLPDNPSIIQQLARLLYRTKEPELKHLSLVKEPPRMKNALAIGVHGYFPAPLIRTVLGQPTGTSMKFADMAAKSIRRWTTAHGYECQVKEAALEGEGKIIDRVELLWKLLLNWIDEIRKSDFILVACHSQGVPVAIMLVAKLIQFGCVNSARIGICAMAGVNMGPFAEYKSRWISGSAGELFEFSDSSSKVSSDYCAALDVVLRFGARLTYIGSIDDQLVSLESSIFSSISHPNIYRAVSIDARVHAPNFLSHLVGFALKLRNLGIQDHGLIRELSSPLAGSLYTGDGHSRLYESDNCYDLAVNWSMLTTTMTDIPISQRSSGTSGSSNPYILPFAMRGILEEEFVKSELSDEASELLKQFDEWKPTSKVLKDVKFRLEGIRSKL